MNGRVRKFAAVSLLALLVLSCSLSEKIEEKAEEKRAQEENREWFQEWLSKKTEDQARDISYQISLPCSFLLDVGKVYSAATYLAPDLTRNIGVIEGTEEYDDTVVGFTLFIADRVIDKYIREYEGEDAVYDVFMHSLSEDVPDSSRLFSFTIQKDAVTMEVTWNMYVDVVSVLIQEDGAEAREDEFIKYLRKDKPFTINYPCEFYLLADPESAEESNHYRNVPVKIQYDEAEKEDWRTVCCYVADQVIAVYLDTGVAADAQVQKAAHDGKVKEEIPQFYYSDMQYRISLLEKETGEDGKNRYRFLLEDGGKLLRVEYDESTWLARTKIIENTLLVSDDEREWYRKWNEQYGRIDTACLDNSKADTVQPEVSYDGLLYKIWCIDGINSPAKFTFTRIEGGEVEGKLERRTSPNKARAVYTFRGELSDGCARCRLQSNEYGDTRTEGEILFSLGGEDKVEVIVSDYDGADSWFGNLELHQTYTFTPYTLRNAKNEGYVERTTFVPTSGEWGGNRWEQAFVSEGIMYDITSADEEKSFCAYVVNEKGEILDEFASNRPQGEEDRETTLIPVKTFHEPHPYLDTDEAVDDGKWGERNRDAVWLDNDTILFWAEYLYDGGEEIYQEIIYTASAPDFVPEERMRVNCSDISRLTGFLSVYDGAAFELDGILYLFSKQTMEIDILCDVKAILGDSYDWAYDHFDLSADAQKLLVCTKKGLYEYSLKDFSKRLILKSSYEELVHVEGDCDCGPDYIFYGCGHARYAPDGQTIACQLIDEYDYCYETIMIDLDGNKLCTYEADGSAPGFQYAGEDGATTVLFSPDKDKVLYVRKQIDYHFIPDGEFRRFFSVSYVAGRIDD